MTTTPARRIADATKFKVRALSLVEFLQETEPDLVLRRSGADYRTACPMEGESGAGSKFRVFEDHYFCNTCQASGDIISFLRARRGLSYEEAVEAAADYGRVPVEYEALTEAAKAAQAVDAEALAVLADLATLSLQTAGALPPDAQQIDAIPLVRLVGTGEVGVLPDAVTLRRWAVARGLTPEMLDRVGLTGQADALGGRWVLWARERGAPVAMRPVGARGPIVGVRGSGSLGWVTPPTVKGYEMKHLAIAMDDAMYLRLRGAGVGQLARPLTPSTMRRKPLPVTRRIDDPPVCLIRPSTNCRKAAGSDLAHLMAVNPRARALEMDPDAVVAIGPRAFAQQFRSAVARAGVVLDWAIERILATDLLESAEGRVIAARRLARLVDAVERPLEREAYRIEMESVTGVGFAEVLAEVRATAEQHAAGPPPPVRPAWQRR